MSDLYALFDLAKGLYISPFNQGVAGYVGVIDEAFQGPRDEMERVFNDVYSTWRTADSLVLVKVEPSGSDLSLLPN